MQIIGVAVWSGCRCSWRWSMMWTHWLQRLDDQCPGLYSPWLTGFVSMGPQSVDVSLSSVVVQERGAADAGCKGCYRYPCYSILGWPDVCLCGFRVLVLVWAETRCCRYYCLIAQEWLVGEATAVLQLVAAAASSSCGLCQEVVVRKPKVISEDFLKLALEELFELETFWN